MDDLVDEISVKTAASVSIPLVLMMNFVGPALIVGSVVIFLDGSLASKTDIIAMLVVSALSLIALGASLRAFLRVLKGGESLSSFHRYMTPSLPVFWLLGVCFGIWASESIIAAQKQSRAESARYACSEFMGTFDSGWVKCLAAVPLCYDEANRCKDIDSEEKSAECLKEYEQRFSALRPSDQKILGESVSNYERKLRKICILERSNE